MFQVYELSKEAVLSPTWKELTWKVSENEEVPQSAKCLQLAQCQTGETHLG